VSQDDQRMFDRFVRLCEIASPTGQEREVADAIMDELRGEGVDIAEDASAVPAETAAGNLIARIPGTGDGWVSFFSHLDTVPHDGPIEVARENGARRHHPRS
jgi:putative aminopeptidase FrvX